MIVREPGVRRGAQKIEGNAVDGVARRLDVAASEIGNVIADFTALTSTNLSLPLDQWTALGNATQSAPGQYQFTDPSATNTAQFYILVSP